MPRILVVGLALINAGAAVCALVAGEPWAIYLAIPLGFPTSALAFHIGNRTRRLGLFIPVGLFAIAPSVGTVIGGRASRVHTAPKAVTIAATQAPAAARSFEFEFSDARIRRDLAHGELSGGRGDAHEPRYV